MDLVYVPEVLTYGFFRNSQYRDYEQPWNRDYFNYGKPTQIACQRVPQQHHEQKAYSKENCHLCRESKRRSLAAYIRGKSRKDSCQEIHEEEEEHETEKSTGENTDADDREPKNENENSKIRDDTKVKRK